MTRWDETGEVIARLRSLTLQEIREPGSVELPGWLEETVLPGRHANAGRLRRAVLDALPDGRVTLHAAADPWATGSSPGLDSSVAGEVDAVAVPCWARSSAPQVSDAVAQLPAEVPVGAYVTAVGPEPRPQLADDVAELVDAGASELHLYHLGLAGPQRWPQLHEAAEAFRCSAGSASPATTRTRPE